MSQRHTSREIWREYSGSVTFLLDRAETEGGRASGPFGPRVEQLIGTATALRMVCRRCEAGKDHHAARDHEFAACAVARAAYKFAWVHGAGDRGEIELDASMVPDLAARRPSSVGRCCGGR